MTFDARNVPLALLMQPELLQEHEIRNILTDRCVRIDNMEYINKEQLLNIYHRVITPLQQRLRHGSDRKSDLNGINKNIFPVVNSESGIGILKVIHESSSTNGRIKCSNNTSPNKVLLKRPNGLDMNDFVPTKKSRQKITWP